jgi:hypothetical protein
VEVVRVELLVVPHCPNEAPALATLRAAAARAGLGDLPVTVTVVVSDQQARERGFIGSPTFLIDGVDAFPVPGASTGVTCRLYRTASGLASVPEVEMLRDALLRA